jgi:uroporphyrin-III C-methyltransferase
MNQGQVYLVGAGPGDPGLFTVRGLELLRSADVIVYDRLVNKALLEEAPAEALRIFAGKAAGNHSLPQEEINAILIEHARAGRNVVRLKGGDPFVFGRGGEEAAALAIAGIGFEVVPGVSSAIAVPAYAGIPLTHRNISSSFAVITGHEACKEGAKIDWSRLASGIDTLVVLMGLTRIPRIAAELIAHGRDRQTPVAIISSGTTEKQRVVTGNLGDIAEKSVAVEPPAVIVIGEVVSLGSELAWLSRLEVSTVSKSVNGKQPANRP